MNNKIIYLLIFFFLTNCSFFKKKSNDESESINNNEQELSPDSTNIIMGTNERGKFLDNAEEFYPINETEEDIKKELEALKAQVKNFESKLNATTTNTDQLKMIRYPDLQHEVELKNGNIIEGSILYEDMNQIIINTRIGQITIDKAEVISIRELASAQAKIEFLDEPSEIISKNKRTYSGKVINNGLERADFVRIIFYLWANNTSLLNSDSAFVDGSTIKFESGIIADSSIFPGETVNYTVSITIDSTKNVQYLTRDLRWDNYK